jgi:hypothetical protein
MIEGACRHLVEDRMGRTGARWSTADAEAILRPFYARIKVAVAWLVGAESRLVFEHRLDAGEWRPIGTCSDEAEARIPSFDAVPLNITAWWMPSEESSP